MNPRVSEALLEEIRSVAETSTHMWVSLIYSTWNLSHPNCPSAPHYHVVSRQVHVGFISPVVNCLRSFLIEGLYRRLGRFIFFGFVDFVCAESLSVHSQYVPGNSQLVDAGRRVRLYPYNLHPKTHVPSELSTSVSTPLSNVRISCPLLDKIQSLLLFIYFSLKH